MALDDHAIPLFSNRPDRGRPRRAHTFPRKWEVTVRKPGENLKRIVQSREELADLQSRYGSYIRAINPVSFESRTWIPFIWGLDPHGTDAVDYKKVAFKAKTEEEAQRKAEAALDDALQSLPVWNGRPHVSGLDEEHYYRATDLLRRPDPRIEEHKRRKGLTLSQWVQKSIKQREEERAVQQTTLATDRQYAKWLDIPTTPSDDAELAVASFVFGAMALESIRMEHLREFVLSLQRKTSPRTGEPLKPKTIENIIAVISNAWSRLRLSTGYEHLIPRLLFDREALPRMKQDVRRSNPVFSAHEINLLIENACDARELAFLGLCLTGIRPPGEVAAVRWSDFFEHGGGRFLRVERSVQHRLVKDVTKTGVRGDRVVPISQPVWGLISQTKPLESDWVLPDFGEVTSPISTKTLQDRFSRLKARAGITRPDARLYDLRATVLSLYRLEAGEEKAALIAGHTETRTLKKHYDRANRADILSGLQNVIPWGLPDSAEE